VYLDPLEVLNQQLRRKLLGLLENIAKLLGHVLGKAHPKISRRRETSSSLGASRIWARKKNRACLTCDSGIRYKK
jgi:hypothetical protein